MINVVHTSARDVHDTDWSQVAALYEQLVRCSPSPIIASINLVQDGRDPPETFNAALARPLKASRSPTVWACHGRSGT